jgi:hypothetical protein
MRYYNYILVVAAVVLVVACNSNESKTTSTDAPKIKKCKIYSSDFSFSDSIETGMLIQELRFNKNNCANELIRYDFNGNVVGRFDITGQNNPFPLPEKLQYIDTILTMIEFDSLGGVKEKTIKTYNSKGLLSEVLYYDGDSLLIKRNTYKYNKYGLITEDVYWDISLNIPKQKIIYEYEFY